MPPLVRGLLRAGLVLLGAILAFACVLAHRHALYVGSVPLPWGLLLSVGTTYAVVRAGAYLDGGAAAGAVAVGAGWVLVVIVASRPRADGDYLLAGDWVGYALILGGMAAAAAAIVRAVNDPPAARKC